MGFKVKPKGAEKSYKVSDLEVRFARLRKIKKVAAWWLVGQGVFYLFLGDRLADWTSMRYAPLVFPVLKMYGVSLVSLGYFLMKALQQPEKEAIAVDTFILFFVGTGIVAFWSAWYTSISKMEWIFVTGDCIFAGLLIRFRKTSRMEAGPVSASLPLPQEVKSLQS